MGTGSAGHGPGGGRREMVRCGFDFWVVRWKTGLSAQEIVSPDPELAMVNVQMGWGDLLLENSLSIIFMLVWLLYWSCCSELFRSLDSAGTYIYTSLRCSWSSLCADDMADI